MTEERTDKFNISSAEKERQKDFSKRVETILLSKGNSQPKAFVHSYGCQGNVSDGERIKGMLCECGYQIADTPENADLVLYNTCAIREHAEDRIFGNVGALKKYKRQNPDFKIVLCGCMMQQEHIKEKFRKNYPYVDMIFGTHVLYKLPELLYRLLSTSQRVFETPDNDGFLAEGMPVLRDSSFKAWLPVMYGCNNFCSYCIVPYVRGRERSRNPEAVISEARELINAGYKEITLLGQNVNSYSGEGYNFSRLLKEINDIPGDFIIRFMTSHPKDCTYELFDTMAQCDKVAKHLHLPCQSGNNRILDVMNRRYTREKYTGLTEYARKVMPNLSITSDIIVGFPGETDEEFEDTLSLVEQVKFTSLFTFIYSPRKGTKAAQMEDPYTHEQKVVRFKALCDLQESIAAKRTASMKDNVYRVLAEERSDSGRISGRTQGNVIIEFEAPDSVIGNFVNVKVTQPRNWIVIGEEVK